MELVSAVGLLIEVLASTPTPSPSPAPTPSTSGGSAGGPSGAVAWVAVIAACITAGIALIGHLMQRRTGREATSAANKAATAADTSSNAASRAATAAEKSAEANRLSSSSVALKNATDLALSGDQAKIDVGVAQLEVLIRSDLLGNDAKELVKATLKAIMEPALAAAEDDEPSSVEYVVTRVRGFLRAEAVESEGSGGDES
jgi:hypothetical protein